MRIGIFSESYEPIINGVSVATAILRDGLVKRGHEVYMFAPRFKGHTDQYSHVCRTPSVGGKNYPVTLPFICGNAKKEFAKLDLDVVHTQIPFVMGSFGQKWAKEYNIPLVSMNHTLYSQYAHYCPVAPVSFTQKVLVNWMRKYYNSCERVCVPSKPMKNLLKSYGVATPIDVIKTGIEPIKEVSDTEREEIRADLGYTKDDILLLYVGRVAREKNVNLLFESFKNIVKPNVHLIVVGGGPALEKSKAFAESLQISDNVRFVGMLPRREIDPYYIAGDIFAFPSVTDTQALTICEAMTASLPCVAMDACGVPENIEDGVDGFLCKNTVGDFTEKLEKLIYDPMLRAQMSVAAKKNSEKFSIDNMIDKFIVFYETAISDFKNR